MNSIKKASRKLKQIQMKNLFCYVLKIGNYTGYKSLKRLKKRVMELKKLGLVPYILPFITWRKKDSYSLDGVTINRKKEWGPDDDITPLPPWEKQPLPLSMNSETISLIGNQLEEENQESIKILFDKIYHYSWSTKWLAIPVALLLPKERMEEWLGDLYQSLYLAFGKYPQWFINLMIIFKTGILIISALKIKISDLLGK